MRKKQTRLSAIRYWFLEKVNYHIPKLLTTRYFLKGVVYGKNTTIKKSEVGFMCRFGYDNMIAYSAIGDYSNTASNTKIILCDIGKFCSIAWNVSIGIQNHPMTKISTHNFTYADKYNFFNKKNFINVTVKRTYIGNDVWIGCNSVIKGGIKIANGAIIGAGAVVTHDIPPYAIAVGNPAKVIKFRFSEDIIDKLEQMKWWDWSYEEIVNNAAVFRKCINNVNDIV